MSGWLVGLATADFTIPLGTPLGGYADREGSSSGTHDELEVSALVLQSGGQTLHVVAVDVVAVDTILVPEVAALCGIPANTLLIGASHTHSGPLGVTTRLHPAGPICLDPNLRDRFVRTIARVITSARATMAPGSLAIGDREVEGLWSSRNDPTDAGDRRVRYLTVRNDGGELVGLLLLIPCHPTVLGSWNLEVSADLHGSIRRSLQSRLGHSVKVLTLTGAAGDISTRFTRRASSFAEGERLGDIVGAAVHQHLHGLQPIGAGLHFTTTLENFIVRKMDPEIIAKIVSEAQARWEDVDSNPNASESDRRMAFTRLQGAELQREVPELGERTWPVSTWLFGRELGLVTVPGELFSTLGRAIESGAKWPSTWVVGYANGYAGYLVDRDAYAKGTYEALASPWAPETGELFVATTLQLLRGMTSSPEERT